MLYHKACKPPSPLFLATIWNTGNNRNTPMTSQITVIETTRRTKPTTSPKEVELVALAKNNLFLNFILLENIVIKNAKTVINPNPPIWIMIRTTN